MVTHTISQTITTSKLFQAVRAYAALGFNILPVGGGKNPLVKTWAEWKTQHQTHEDLRAMPWKKAKGVAVVCGKVSGFVVVVDFDKQSSRVAVNDLLKKLGLPPNYQWVVKTPGGGWHIWLIVCDNAVLTVAAEGSGKLDRKGRIEGHIELRFEGVLTMLPPSLHPSGGFYAFTSSEPTEPPVTVEAEKLLAAYDAITVKEDPKPKAPPVPRAKQPALVLGEDHPYERWCLEVEQAAIAAWNITPPNGKNLSRKNFSSPLREDRKPSAQWNYSVHGFHDYGPDEFFSTHRVAEYLGFPSWQDYKAARREFTTPTPRRAPLPPDATRFPGGAPETLIKRIHRLSTLIDIEKQHPAAYGLILWHELAHLIPDGVWLDWGGFQAATGQISRDASTDTVKTLLEQLAGLDIVERIAVADITPTGPRANEILTCDLTLEDGQSLPAAQVLQWRGKTRPRVLYRFRPAAQQLAGFEGVYCRALREYAFQHAPDKVQPEWGALLADEVRDWDDYRDPVYQHYAEQRARAAEQLEHALGLWEGDKERIETGRNRFIILPPGRIRNAVDYRAAFHKAMLIQHGGERENAYKARFELGVSRSALARIRDRASVITIERTKTVATAELTDFERDYLVKAYHSDGTATVRLPYAEKLIDLATPEEIEAYAEHRAAQQRRVTRQPAPDTAAPPESIQPSAPQPPQAARPKRKNLPLVVWKDYSEEFKLRQYAFAPLPADFSPFDPATGELYTADQLWKLGATYLRDKQLVAPPQSIRPDLVPHPDAPNHPCGCCDQPAAYEDFTGWYCTEHRALPILERIALARHKEKRRR
jgi:hypothetical protein